MKQGVAAVFLGIDCAAQAHVAETARAGHEPDYGPCVSERNPHNPSPVLRALVVALDAWASRGVAPPDSRVLTIAGVREGRQRGDRPALRAPAGQHPEEPKTWNG